MSSSCFLLPARGFRREVHVSQETTDLSERRKPAFKLPVGACDAHCHVFGPGAVFPYAPNRRYTPEDAPKDPSWTKLLAFSDEIQDEDVEICETVQRNLRSRVYDRGRYSAKRENGVHHFHSLLHEFLT